MAPKSLFVLRVEVVNVSRIILFVLFPHGVRSSALKHRKPLGNSRHSFQYLLLQQQETAYITPTGVGAHCRIRTRRPRPRGAPLRVVQAAVAQFLTSDLSRSANNNAVRRHRASDNCPSSDYASGPNTHPA